MNPLGVFFIENGDYRQIFLIQVGRYKFKLITGNSCKKWFDDTQDLLVFLLDDENRKYYEPVNITVDFY